MIRDLVADLVDQIAGNCESSNRKKEEQKIAQGDPLHRG